MKRALVLAAVLAVAAVANAAPERTPSLSAVRICSGAYQDGNGECLVDQRRRLLLYPEVRCSVHVDAPRPTRFTARILYQGQVERSYSVVLAGGHTRAIAVAFSSLGGDDYGVPGGRYSCQFALGRARASVTGTSRGPARRVRAPAACPVYGTGSRMCTPSQPVFFAPPRSLSCSIVLVGMRGRVATTQLQRRAGDAWSTLYAASDRLTVPIAEVWAYTSASPGPFFAAGDYRCRFLADGSAVAEKQFSVRA